MFLAFALAAATAASPARPQVQARATVRILRPASNGTRDWTRLPSERRRELIVKDERGAPVLLRIIDNE